MKIQNAAGMLCITCAQHANLLHNVTPSSLCAGQGRWFLQGAWGDDYFYIHGDIAFWHLTVLLKKNKVFFHIRNIPCCNKNWFDRWLCPWAVLGSKEDVCVCVCMHACTHIHITSTKYLKSIRRSNSVCSFWITSLNNLILNLLFNQCWYSHTPGWHTSLVVSKFAYSSNLSRYCEWESNWAFHVSTIEQFCETGLPEALDVGSLTVLPRSFEHGHCF